VRRRFILVIQEAVSSGVEEGGRYTPLDKNVEEDEERDTFDDEMGKGRPDDVAPKDETPEKGKTSCLKVPPWLREMLTVVLFYAAGLLYYGHFSDTGWDYHTAFYFTSISITTVGYGDFSPKTAQDKLFTMVYVIVGFMSVYAVIADATATFFAYVDKRIKIRKKEEDLATALIPPDDADVDADLFRRRLLYFALILLLQLGGALIVSRVEGWTFVDGLYWAFQTTSTVGYGDEFLHKRSRIFGAFYALASVGTLAACFAGLSGAKQEADAEKHYRKLMRNELDGELIMKLDKNGDGISRAEFLTGMLVAMELVDERECLGLLARFDQLDTDGSGQLDHDDLVKIANSYGRPLTRTSSLGSFVGVPGGGSGVMGRDFEEEDSSLEESR